MIYPLKTFDDICRQSIGNYLQSEDFVVVNLLVRLYKENENIIWGTDYPMYSYEESLKRLEMIKII